MRRLSMVIIGLTLAATAASAEPLRLGDMDLDLVTADMLGSSLVPRVAQSRDRGSFDEDANAGVDDVDLAAPLSALRVSNDDADNAVRDSDVLVLRGSDPSDTGVAVLKSAAVAGIGASASGNGTVSRQAVVRTSTTNNVGVVRPTGNPASTGDLDSARSVASGGFERRIPVRNDNAGSSAGIRGTSLFADNGNAGLSISRLDRSITPGRFDASAFRGGSVTSMLGGNFN